MPQLRDVVTITKTVGLWELTKRVYKQIGEDNLFTLGSALAYSWLFSIFPFFIFLLTLVPYIPAEYRDQAKERIRESITQTLPAEGAAPILENIKSLFDKPRGGLLSIGIILTLWGASGGMAATMAAIDKCYDVELGRPFYMQRPLAIALTVVVATLIVCVLILLPVLGYLINYMQDWGPFTRWLEARPRIKQFFVPIFWVINSARWMLALFFMFAALSVVYHFSPRIKHRYRFITPGSVFCVVVWITLGLLFRFYVDKFGDYNKTYGTIGGVAIILLFFYIDAVVLLVGAEINSEIDFQVLGLKPGDTDFTIKPAPRLPFDEQIAEANEEIAERPSDAPEDEASKAGSKNG